MGDTNSEQPASDPFKSPTPSAASDTNNEKPASDLSHKPSRTRLFQNDMEEILVKLKHNPSGITTQDARRLSENVEARDEKSARIISAVEAFAVANADLHEQDPALDQAPQTSLLTVVKDLNAAVDANPHHVTTEVLRTAQGIVGKMQKAVGNTKAPHPELETKLQEEMAKIEPKVAQGTVTKAEADHLHSLEARAHGHTEKGGITAIAQSVAARRERKLSLSSGSSRSLGGSTPNSQTFTTSPGEQSHRDNETTLQQVAVTMNPTIDGLYHSIIKINDFPDQARWAVCNRTNVTNILDQTGVSITVKGKLYPPGEEPGEFDLPKLYLLVEGYTENGVAQAMRELIRHLCEGTADADQKRRESFSNRSNASPRASEADYERRKEQSHHDEEISPKIAEPSIEPKVDEENISKNDTADVQSREHHAHGHDNKGSVASEAMSKSDKNGNSQPIAESSR